MLHLVASSAKILSIICKTKAVTICNPPNLLLQEVKERMFYPNRLSESSTHVKKTRKNLIRLIKKIGNHFITYQLQNPKHILPFFDNQHILSNNLLIRYL